MFPEYNQMSGKLVQELNVCTVYGCCLLLYIHVFYSTRHTCVNFRVLELQAFMW